MKRLIILILFFILIFIVGCSPNKYIVTLVHNENITTLDYEEGSLFNFGEIYEEGYIFYGWFDESGNNVEEVFVNSNMRFIGKYIKEGTMYKINYILNGGQLRSYAPLEYEVGKITELPKPLPVVNMKFIGWFISNIEVTEIDGTYYNDLTIEAKWEDNNIYHSIKYNLDGCSINGECVTTFIEGVDNFALPIPAKEGYLFRGWYTDKDYNNRIYSITTKTNTDLDLYPKFELYNENNLTVSFLGDSITTYTEAIPSAYPSYYPTQGCDVNSVEKTWWYQVLSQTGYQLIMNNSYSGSKVTSGDGCARTIERIQNLSKDNVTPDIIIIYMGTNDLTHRVEINTFEKGYREMLQLIKQECDDAIVYVLNFPSMKHQGFLNERLAYNEVIAKIAKENNLILVDIASVITEGNYSEYLFAGAHPNALGMQLISNKVIETIEKNK